MIVPTPKAALFFASSIPVALVVVSVWSRVWYVSFYIPIAVLALMMADAMMVLPNRILRAEWDKLSRLPLGQSGTFLLRLDAGGYGRPVVLQALAELTGEVDHPEIVFGTMQEGRLELKLPIVPQRRGVVVVEAVWLRWRGPLGLIEVRRRQPVGENIDVIPDVKGIHEAVIQFFSTHELYGVKTQKIKGEGSEFENLCDYAPGMDNRLIDWKRSARHRKILCKEFRQERNHHIVLGFDTGRLMSEPIEGIPKLDHAIKSALLLCRVSLHGGDLVGGCGFDARFRNFLTPGRGMSYFTQFQRFISGLSYQPEETNFTLGLAELSTRLHRRALVILFTEFVDVISAELLIESLRLMARRHVVVFVTMRDPLLTQLQEAPPNHFMNVAEAVIAADFLRERLIVLERIARLGVYCIDVPAGGISAALLNRYLMIKQRGLL